MIYLDNAATTFPKPECVYQCVNSVQRDSAVNVGRGSYRIAEEANKTVDDTRLLLASLVGADNSNDVVFAPSATIAANELVFGLDWNTYKVVYVSPFEHNAIARPLHIIQKQYGVKIKILPFDGKTHSVDVDEIERQFALDNPDYVFLNHVSNVTGTIVPVTKIASLAKQYDAIVIVDGSQSVGILEYDLKKSDVDYLIFAGHKNLYSSWGVGGFVSNSKTSSVKPVFAGGTGSDSLNLEMNYSTPSGFEFGSPNIIAISSLNASIKWLNKIGIENISQKKKKLMTNLIGELQNDKNIKLYLPSDLSSHTSVLSINVDDYEPSDVGVILDSEFDIAVRTGYHCAPYIHRILGTEDTMGTVRISLSYFNTESDIEVLLKAIRSL